MITFSNIDSVILGIRNVFRNNVFGKTKLVFEWNPKSYSLLYKFMEANGFSTNLPLFYFGIYHIEGNKGDYELKIKFSK